MANHGWWFWNWKQEKFYRKNKGWDKSRSKEKSNFGFKWWQKELIKHFKSKKFDITTPILKKSQEEKKEITNKIFQCIENISTNSKNTLTKDNMEKIDEILKKSQNNEKNSKEYNKFIKKNNTYNSKFDRK